MMAYVAEHNPPFVVFENVCELISRSENIQHLVECFNMLGYKVAYSQLCSSDFGLPQKRHRAYGVAVRSRSAGLSDEDSLRVGRP